MELRKILGALATAAVLATAGGASAAVTELTFAAPGAQPQVYFNGFAPGTTTIDPRLSATLDLSLTSVTNGGYQWNFSYSLANTSTIASRVSTIGWDISADFLDVIGVGGVFSNAADGNMASLGDMDFCLKDSNGANCSGGGGGGLSMGQSGSGAFSLTFLDHTTTYVTVQVARYNKKGQLTGYDEIQMPQVNPVAAPTTVAFNSFGLRMQSLNGGFSTVGVSSTPPPPVSGIGGFGEAAMIAVPEPATWAMMIMGFGVIGAVMRRRRVALD